MAINLSPIWGAGAQLFDNSGNVLSGGKIYTYAAGTTTPATTYTSSNGITANSNPIILNSAGRVPYEIWLSDTVAYKFVLKDSNDTLIATYDNLVGINSNYIAYTAQQEIQTAAAGQTVFNLTTMQYQPATNNLSVFVDGVNQYGPGAQYAYVETDSDTVTFVSGLHVGASVKFTTATPVSSGSTNAENVAYDPPFTGSVSTNVEAKLAEFVSISDFGGTPPPVDFTNQWYWNTTKNRTSASGGSYELEYNAPSTVIMAGGTAVQGSGIVFIGETSAQTPNPGLAETNCIRMLYTINSDAGSKLQCHLINGLLIVENDEGGFGNESAFILGTTRSTGPTSGTAAVGVWGADFHVEKSTGVLDGKMVGLEVGVHKAPALGTARNIGIDIWSGDRSGITATRAGDGIQIHGGAGWTNFLQCVHTDGVTTLYNIDQYGNMTLRSPSSDQSVVFTTNVANKTSTVTVSGKNSSNDPVNAVLQAQASGQIQFGASTNHHLVIVQNNAEVMRFIEGYLYQSPSAVETTASSSASLGANCPATTPSAPYRWIKSRTSDGSTVYFPVWK